MLAGIEEVANMMEAALPAQGLRFPLGALAGTSC